MSGQTRLIGRTHFEVVTPPGWDLIDYADGREGVELRGPRDLYGNRPTITATLQSLEESGAEAIEVISRDVLEEILRCRPMSLITACDMWPHPSWGLGRAIHTALTDRFGRAMAHDTYVFVADHRRVTIDVMCALDDLLSLEADVATIIAGVRAVEPR